MSFTRKTPSFVMYQETFGDCQTHCYILQNDNGEVIIDPGVGASDWVRHICKHPLAILNTHGHYDHVWSNQELQDSYPNIPLIIHEDDAFMLHEDIFGLGMPQSTPTQLIKGESENLNFGGISLTFRHFPGHTPGCCIIETEHLILSGDFIFYRSIGRYDFPFSSATSMKKSLSQFKTLSYDKDIYPGHGPATTIHDEQQHLDIWISRM